MEINHRRLLELFCLLAVQELVAEIGLIINTTMMEIQKNFLTLSMTLPSVE